ncbi:MAG: murein biosynthesis integral membrane protein MurJ [Renibacterium salmoninarum]|nr:murein biosynthesis integral membrane protein MurJ [Renibacterium salmoninarum]
MADQINNPATELIATVGTERTPVNTARSSAIMAAGTLFSRVLGFAKGVLIAVALGTTGGGLSDIFDISNTLPNLIYIMLAGGVFNVILVPQIIKASRLPDRGADFISRIFTLGGLVLLGIAILFTLLAPVLVQVLTKDFNPQQLALATSLAYLLLPQIFFYGIYALLGQLLNANNRFGAYMWAPVLNNIVAITGIGVFIAIWGQAEANPHTVENWSAAQTWILAGSTTLGVVLQSIILIVPVKRLGLGLRPKWGWRGIGLGGTGKVAGWALSTMIIGQLSFMVINWVGSAATAAKENPETSDVAGMFVFNRATDIYMLPHSVIVLSIATIYFNQLSRSAGQGNLRSLRNTTSRLLRTVGVATVFFAVVLLVLAAPIGMLLSGGRAQDGLTVGIAVAILALGAPFFSFNFMLNRVFYATEDARTPFFLQAFIVILTVLSALIVAAVPVSVLAFSLLATLTLVNFIAPVVTAMVLRSKIGDFGIRRIVRSHVQYAVGALFSAVIGGLLMIGFGGLDFGDGSFPGFVWQSFGHAVLVIAVVGSVMALSYVLALRLMNVKELNDVIGPLTRRFSRTRS